MPTRAGNAAPARNGPARSRCLSLSPARLKAAEHPRRSTLDTSRPCRSSENDVEPLLSNDDEGPPRASTRPVSGVTRGSRSDSGRRRCRCCRKWERTDRSPRAGPRRQARQRGRADATLQEAQDIDGPPASCGAAYSQGREARGNVPHGLARFDKAGDRLGRSSNLIDVAKARSPGSSRP